ncbi:MAG: protein O-mannosyl-transferase family, partial [Anaerolineae bacterium]
ATFAVSANLWQHSTFTNAHTLTATLAALALFLLLAWDKSRDDRWLYAFALTCGLGLTHHPLLLISFPAFAAFILLVKPQLLISPRRLATTQAVIASEAKQSPSRKEEIASSQKTLLAMTQAEQLRKLAILGLLFLLGLSVYVYYPIRSAPPFGPQDTNTLDGFLQVVTAQGLRMNLFPFGWREQPQRLLALKTLLGLQYDAPAILLGIVGAIWLALKRRKAFALLALFFALNSAFIMNTIQDVMKYLHLPFMIYAVWIGCGAMALFALLERWQVKPQTKVPCSVALALLLLASPLRMGLLNFSRVDLSDYRLADDFVQATFDSFQDDSAVLLCDWDHITPLWYYEFVEGRKPKVEAKFVPAGTANPWLEWVEAHLSQGVPVYLSGYRRSVAEKYRLLPVGPFYKVLPEPMFEAPPMQHPLDVTVEDVPTSWPITLLGYDLDRQVARVGETLHLTLYLQALQKLDEYYMPFVHLAHWYRFTTDSRFLTPFWEPGQVVAERYDITIPFGTEPGEYPLELGITSLSRGQDLPLSSGGTTIELTTVRVEAGEIQPPSDLIKKALANFDSKILLEKARTKPTVVRPGEALYVTLYWRALQPIDECYTIFVHVIDSSNRIWGQKDFTSLGGSYPTFLWIPKWLEGQVIDDRYIVVLDPQTPPGEYWIEVGMYGIATTKRLPIFDQELNLTSDRVILGSIRVE